MKAEQLAGKYLIFCLGNDTYGIPANKVKEIITNMPITNLPHSPKYVKGIINIKGKVIPLLDFRLRFNMPEKKYTDRTYIIVIQFDEEQLGFMGIAVDNVSEVINISSDNIDIIPDFKGSVHIDHIMGIAKLNDDMIILLYIDKILDEQELNEFIVDIASSERSTRK